MILGLTGPTGAGKTTFCKEAVKEGFAVINADEVAHKVLETEEVKTALGLTFGHTILKDGHLDHKALASLAFADATQTERLNQTVLPFISAEINRLIRENKEPHLVLDAPTLFESGLDAVCDDVLCVLSDRDKRKARILSRDNMTEEAAEQRLDAAKEDAFFLSRCRYVLFNNQTVEAFADESARLLKQILQTEQE